MSKEIKELFETRLKRYQAAIALETPDRIPIASGNNYFAEIYAGHNYQQLAYDGATWHEADSKFIHDFPETDTLANVRIWAPMHDAVGFNSYQIPGRELSPDTQFQANEREIMNEHDYDLLISNPTEFMFERYMQGVFNDFKERGSMRSYVAAVKAGMATGMFADQMMKRVLSLETEFGMPSPYGGFTICPFDFIADILRGLNGTLLDIQRRPDKLLEACDALLPHLVNLGLALADPLRRYPVFFPLTRGTKPFLSPGQFETFYWPTLKKSLMMIIEAGYTVRLYLEGDWEPVLHHFRELPKGKVLCDIDDAGDIFRAKEVLGDFQCIAGGMPDSLLILGSPEDVHEKTKKLCETVGKDGGYIINGGCAIPYDTKPENYRAMIDAVMTYGRYSDQTSFDIQMNPNPPEGWVPPTSGVITPWEVKKEELGGIAGDENMIRQSWEALERMANLWLWMWL